jgi:uncharacterized hydrophobic protein (TIGR00271 family)
MSTVWPHVEPAVLRSLERRLESQSSLSLDFVVLLSGATFIATFGLLQNSPAVIIGAMIIAPLMRPILGLSLATITADLKLLLRAVFSILVGTITAIFIAALIARIFVSLEFTNEVIARTHPTILDLGVAISAGAVGAYCHADEKLADTLAGVAIAVALVPPLSVVGIGLAHSSTSVWSGALLLYATNLVGISLAGSLIFLLKGFTPLNQAKRGLTISLIMSVLLIVPLGFSMHELIVENQVSAQIKSVLKEKTFTFKDMQLENVKVKSSKRKMIAFVTVSSPDSSISSHQVSLVENFLNKEIGTPIELHLRIIQARDVTAEKTVGESISPNVTEIRQAELSPVEPLTEPSESPLKEAELDKPKEETEPVFEPQGR